MDAAHDRNRFDKLQPAQGKNDKTMTPLLEPLDHPRMTPSTDLSMIEAVSPFNQDDTRAILRQVEFYFSDQNLRQDRHLLGLADGNGNGPVSINQICGFKRMRAFKPRAAIVKVLERSAVLDIVGKKVKRRFPLHLKLLVEPQVDVERIFVEQTLAQNPHLTKQMLKPTGFEDGATHFPITPQEYEKNLHLYDPELAFWIRIENALTHYCSKRKMHQKTKRVFDLWMQYGGIANGPSPFSSGAAGDISEDLSKEDVANMKHQFNVDQLVIEAEDDWEVDFEATALGFLSTEFVSWCDSWCDSDVGEQIDNVCNVMKNFFNFLLHHNVCPEYARQLHAARLAIDGAAIELKGLRDLDKALRHKQLFNAACRVLCENDQSASSADWDDTSSSAKSGNKSLSHEEALNIFFAGITAFDLKDQLGDVLISDIIANGLSNSTSPTSETLDLEITSIEMAAGQRADFFALLQDTIVPAMGLMHCKIWKRPYEVDRGSRCRLPEEFTFIFNGSALANCSVGMKLDAQVTFTAGGFCWIDELYNVHPSCYLWLPNSQLIEIKQRIKVLDEVGELLKQNAKWVQDDSGVLQMINKAALPEDRNADIQSMSPV